MNFTSSKKKQKILYQKLYSNSQRNLSNSLNRKITKNNILQHTTKDSSKINYFINILKPQKLRNENDTNSNKHKNKNKNKIKGYTTNNNINIEKNDLETNNDSSNITKNNKSLSVSQQKKIPSSSQSDIQNNTTSIPVSDIQNTTSSSISNTKENINKDEIINITFKDIYSSLYNTIDSTASDNNSKSEIDKPVTNNINIPQEITANNADTEKVVLNEETQDSSQTNKIIKNSENGSEIRSSYKKTIIKKRKENLEKNLNFVLEDENRANNLLKKKWRLNQDLDFVNQFHLNTLSYIHYFVQRRNELKNKVSPNNKILSLSNLNEEELEQQISQEWLTLEKVRY